MERKKNETGGGSLKKKGSSRQNRPPNSIFTQGNFFENKEMYE